MRQSIPHRFVVSLLVLSVLSGCALSGGFRPEGAKVPPAQSTVIVTALRDNTNIVRSYRGLARGVFTNKKEKIGVRYILVFDRPGRVRVELIPVGSAYALNVLAAAPGRVTVLDTPSRRAFIGNDGDKALRKGLSLPLSVEELSSYLVGEIPPSLLDGEISVYRVPDSSRTQIVKDGGKVAWELDEHTKQLHTVVVGAGWWKNGGRVELSGYRSDWCPGFSIPSSIVVSIPAESITLTLNLEQVRCNEILNQKLFALDVPDGYSAWTAFNSDTSE